MVYSSGANVMHLWQVTSGDGPLAVEVMGDALGQDSAGLASRVTEIMRASTSDPWLKFEPDRTKTNGGYRMVFLFDARTVRQPDFFVVCAGKPPRFEEIEQELAFMLSSAVRKARLSRSRAS